MGAPLTGGQTLTRDGKSRDSNNGVRGYSILQFENMEEAKALLQGHPHFMWSDGCTIEVHEINVASEM